ncbi:DUF2642 domain-containing protein [Oceanobacillus salinisoli]|uniref:DUF2642 domain-containing protein n=1 Tax=Oceanobacillus salinisoli TaxID=2678611 RepID=UPI0012E23CB8|nr:DUF2642 domain-containing protein [Oceanobacillus salinisoli]
MYPFNHYLNKQIEVKTSDDKYHTGILVDEGTDVIVLFNGEDLIYISNRHLHQVKQYLGEKNMSLDKNDIPIINHLSLRKTLNSLKGDYTAISVGNTETVHGYVTNVMTDYFVYYSPVYKTMFIPFRQLKWLIPYKSEETPYALEKEKLRIKPSHITLARTFDVQLEKLKGHIILLDFGLYADRIGQLKEVTDNFMELKAARGDSVYIHLSHIKSVHFQ